MRMIRMAAAGLAGLIATASAAQPGQGIRPVRIGLAGSDMDACLSLA